MNPFLYNRLKHHKIYIEEFIRNFSGDFEMLRKELLVIGESQLDLYIGIHREEAIEEEISELLKAQKVYSEEMYTDWLQIAGGFRYVDLSDGSRWILRLGEHKEAFIHIHPGRYSPHTIRVKAGVLKIVIACLVYCRKNMCSVSLDTINIVRTEILQMSPVKTLSRSIALLKTLECFEF